MSCAVIRLLLFATLIACKETNLIAYRPMISKCANIPYPCPFRANERWSQIESEGGKQPLRSEPESGKPCMRLAQNARAHKLRAGFCAWPGFYYASAELDDCTTGAGEGVTEGADEPATGETAGMSQVARRGYLSCCNSTSQSE